MGRLDCLPMRTRWIALALALCACHSGRAAESGPAPRASSAESFDSQVRRIDQAIAQLYEAFGFEAGATPDFAHIESLCAKGATFVAPIGKDGAATGVPLKSFIADFEAYVRTAPVRDTGLFERVLHTRIDGLGTVAHAFVAFEGYVPSTGERKTRGLDSLQWVLDQGQWRLISFTTQYEQPNQELARRFLGP